MRIAYVLPEPALGGGTKVVFQHANLLLGLGHKATVLARGVKPEWIDFQGAYLNYEEGYPKIGEQDLVIATYWSSIPVAEDFAIGPLTHFCQGYEGDWPHLSELRSEIESVYKRDLPTLVVTPYLADLLRRRFGRESRVVPPIVDPIFRPAFRVKPSKNPWVMVSGIFEAELKGIRTSLEAIVQLRKMGHHCRVLRISILPITDDEKAILIPDCYLCAVDPEVVARRMRRCDLLLFSSQPTEGFGLPVLEAMASKVPVVASRIPSTEFMGAGDLTLVDPNDPSAFALAADHILKNRRLWHRARDKGHKAAFKFHPQEIARHLREGIKWARNYHVGRFEKLD